MVTSAVGVLPGQIAAGKYTVTDPLTGQLIGVQVDASGRLTTIAQVVNTSSGAVAGASLSGAAAVAQAVQAQTGQVVTGNTILNAQTGAVQSVTGAVNAQTGAVLTGNTTADAVKNLTALDTVYSEQMIQALSSAANSQSGTFTAMLQGINNVVSVLSDVRTLLGSTAGAMDPVGVAAPTLTLSDGSKVAFQLGVPVSASSYLVSEQQTKRTAALAGQYDTNADFWNRFFNNNTDLETRYASLVASGATGGPLATTNTNGEMPWQWVRDLYKAGNWSDRALFATGAAFMGEGVYQRPTSFPMGTMAEAGPEAIMPLTNVGGRLGVYAQNDNSSAAEMRAMRQELEKTNAKLANLEVVLKAANSQRGAAAVAQIERLDTVADKLDGTRKAIRAAS